MMGNREEGFRKMPAQLTELKIQDVAIKLHSWERP